nr:heavy metal-associated domain-containing protein [methane-oxidizing endosymbiont of Gigantopelta aegis]
MFTKNTLLISTLLISSALFTNAISATSQVTQQLKSVTLDVQNMTCAMCKITIRKALEKVAGVKNATVDFNKKTVTIQFEPKRTSVQELIKATTNVGYPASVHTNKTH